MKFHSTEQEEEIMEKIMKTNPDIPDYMASLMAWVYINKPERYLEIIREHAEKEDESPVELSTLDYEKLFNIKLKIEG